ncbi:type VI secretion system baseplate subunit TssF [Pantoea sp. LS15]|uniref:type VI secretion system baseplate subunit TssF n=1 Tax=Enterobacterales TaxID=91347 RepID=UPI000E0E3BE9|nr:MULTISPECIES: type VI secretion system baseplate subunit TssF [Enterobacterales]NJQ21797.1 type VI secretion system baseplate subunit TssF [Pantoea sp. LS15]NKF48393.1 type VI secretion system baseplate subunit TssF [Pantoea sp. LS15]RDK12951.1 type VI secretion system baseplate subunit TssF [Enterobacter sp. 9-2]
MDNNLLRHYERELQFLREAGQEFAADYPGIASRLGMAEQGAPDPSVERLLEGVAFLTARIQLQLEAAFPQFSENLLSLVQPEVLTPTPAFAVAQLTPDWGEGSLKEGYTLPAGERLSEAEHADRPITRCEFRLLSPVTLWPIVLSAVSYVAAPLSGMVGGGEAQGVAQLRLRLCTQGGQLFSDLDMDELSVYIPDGVHAAALYEAMIVQCSGVAIGEVGAERWCEGVHIHPDGMLNPAILEDAGSDYTVLKHFFAFPQGYRFVRLVGLREVVKSHPVDCLDIVMVLNTRVPVLSKALNAEAIALFCAPIANMFHRRCDRIRIDHYSHEYPVIIDRIRRQDHLLHRVLSVRAFAANGRELGQLAPLYGGYWPGERTIGEYSLRRSGLQCGQGGDASSTVFISVHGGNSAEIKQLGVTAVCSNGGLPLQMALGKGNTDLVPERPLPVRAIRIITGPSRPLASPEPGERARSAINHLSRGYLSLAAHQGEVGAQALRELLALFLMPGNQVGKRWLAGIDILRSRTVVRRLPGPGPIVFARGTRFELELDETAYEGIGALLFGSLLDVFLTRYAALNSFTELSLTSRQRGFLKLWAARRGQCPVI